MKLRFYSMFFVILLLTSCKSAIIEIDQDIPLEIEVTSAKELVSYVAPYVLEIWHTKNYFVGEVFMSLDKDLVGDVHITYTDTAKKGVPRLAHVEIDTRNRKIKTLYRWPREEKAYPGRTKFEDWLIDSMTAFEITEKQFGGDDLYFNKVLLHAFSIVHEGVYREKWQVSLSDDHQKITYMATIDPYSGEVINWGISNWPTP